MSISIPPIKTFSSSQLFILIYKLLYLYSILDFKENKLKKNCTSEILYGNNYNIREIIVIPSY